MVAVMMPVVEKPSSVPSGGPREPKGPFTGSCAAAMRWCVTGSRRKSLGNGSAEPSPSAPATGSARTCTAEVTVKAVMAAMSLVAKPAPCSAAKGKRYALRSCSSCAAAAALSARLLPGMRPWFAGSVRSTPCVIRYMVGRGLTLPPPTICTPEGPPLTAAT